MVVKCQHMNGDFEVWSRPLTSVRMVVPVHFSSSCTMIHVQSDLSCLNHLYQIRSLASRVR